MISRFADTWFYIALLDRDDAHHRKVRDFVAAHDDFYVTTRWILAETANALGATNLRTQAIRLLDEVESDPNTQVVKSSDEIYSSGRALFSRRRDKDWSLTDCISFVVMEEQGLTEALTGDQHFNQAGFQAIFAR